MRLVQGLLLLTFLGAMLIFALQNSQPVSLRFLGWGLSTTMSLQSVTVYLLGMLSGWTVVAFLRRSIRGISERSN